MKKLAIILTHPIQYYSPLFRLLSQRGNIEVKVFYTFEKEDLLFDEGFGKAFAWDIPILDGYSYDFVSNNGNAKKGFLDVRNPTLINNIVEWGANAVMVFGWNYFSHLKAMYYFKNKIPVLFRGDSTLLDEPKGFSFKKKIRRIVLKKIYGFVDYALYVGYNSKLYFLKHELKENQLYFAPHAIDNQRFSEINETQKEWVIKTRKDLNIKDDDIVFLYCGKFQSKKNPLLLVQAFTKLKNKKKHLILIGNGELEQEINKLIIEQCNIHVMPFQNQSLMPAVYRLGDVFCLPSQGPGETWGLAINEAMACSKPCLISNKVGCAKDLINEQTGWVFESNNINQLYNLLKIIENKQTLQEMGMKAKNLISNWNFLSTCIVIENILK